MATCVLKSKFKYLQIATNGFVKQWAFLLRVLTFVFSFTLFKSSIGIIRRRTYSVSGILTLGDSDELAFNEAP